jgi:nicotinamidase-related amidase
MKNIIEHWQAVTAPNAPELLPVKFDPSHMAILVLDLQKNNCNSERRPRCVDTISEIKKFIETARAKNATIAYSLTSKGEPDDILNDLAPLANDHIVKSSVDKFFNTDLEDYLKEAGMDAVIIVGTAAEGAVLHTTAGAAMRGFNAVVPVDGLSSSTEYAEQYTVWHLVNSPGTKKRTTLTRLNMISL